MPAPGNQPGSSGSAPQGYNFLTTSAQNHIHELAKTLPPPRKQNTACDACRTRKVKCNVIPGQDKCQHCLAKNCPCTHLIQQATTERKRNAAQKRARTQSATAPSHQPPSIGPIRTESTPRPSPYPLSTPPPPAAQASTSQGPTSIPTRITSQTTTKELLAYLFSPPESRNGSSGPTPYAEWGDLAHQLELESFRNDFAFDLVEVFFQIVHLRLPLLNPIQFRARFHTSIRSQTPPPTTPTIELRMRRSHSPQTAAYSNSNQNSPKSLHSALHDSGQIDNALAATVISWGAKFSEHPLLMADRARNNGQSLLAKTLIDRTRDLAEDLKVHRVPTADHVVTALLIEPLQSQDPDEPQGYHGFWLTSAIRLLMSLGINRKSVTTSIEDYDVQGTMVFAWWMACLADAYRSIYYRRKPILDDDDYDIDFYTAEKAVSASADNFRGDNSQVSPREQLQFLGYYRAAHALARISRQMSRQLWKPSTETDGIPLQTIWGSMEQLSEWKTQFYSQVGVPPNFPVNWDFISCVTACASDATYNIQNIILFFAVDDFGITEEHELFKAHSSPEQTAVMMQKIEQTKKKLFDDTLHSASRIAALAGVLTTNGYMRLDSAVMHVSCIQAGTFLAKLGRPEVENCIEALKQYSHSYEEMAERARDIQRVYDAARNGESDFTHMASVIPKPAPEFSHGVVSHPHPVPSHQRPPTMSDPQQPQQQQHQQQGVPVVPSQQYSAPQQSAPEHFGMLGVESPIMPVYGGNGHY
ncbi:hypothetical protein K474DRAFT_1656349 [Panus rudis PR-1116 ss-1]|nr:hypothetical protein K474DRAFT_1656349 [Panus rudis PR-1116 ss-1]